MFNKPERELCMENIDHVIFYETNKYVDDGLRLVFESGCRINELWQRYDEKDSFNIRVFEKYHVCYMHGVW